MVGLELVGEPFRVRQLKSGSKQRALKGAATRPMYNGDLFRSGRCGSSARSS